MAFGWSRTAGLARATGFTRTSQRYRSRRDPAIGPRMRPKELAASRVRHGYGRLHILLRREGWPVNHNRTCPALPGGGPVDRPKVPRRKRARRTRQERLEVGGPHEV